MCRCIKIYITPHQILGIQCVTDTWNDISNFTLKAFCLCLSLACISKSFVAQSREISHIIALIEWPEWFNMFWLTISILKDWDNELEEVSGQNSNTCKCLNKWIQNTSHASSDRNLHYFHKIFLKKKSVLAWKLSAKIVLV